MPSKRQMLRSSSVVAAFSFLGSLAGILVEICIAAKLGLSKASDTFYVAYTVPYIITNLISATGQFSLVPFYSSLEASHSSEDLWRGLSYAANVVFLGLSALAALGVLAAPLLIRGIAPGFTPAQTKLATQLARWLFLVIVPAGVAETLRSFLLSQHRFAVPSSAGLFRNVTVVASILLGFKRYGFYSIVFGYLAGYLLQFAVMAGQLLISFPVRYWASLKGSGEAFRNLRGAGLAQVMTALSWQGLVIVERIIASFLPPGTLTALAYSIRIMSALAAVLAGSVGTAVLPTLSKAFARRQMETVRKVFRDTLEFGLVLTSPAFVFCLMVPQDIIRLVFERGRFTAASTALMSQIFFYYILSIFFYAALRVLNFYFFARNEARLFVRLSLFQFSLNIALDLFYVFALHLGAIGIPLGFLTSAAATCGLAVYRDYGDLRDSLDRSLGILALKVGGGVALAVLVMEAMKLWLQAPPTGLGNFVFLVEAGLIETAVFFAVLFVTRAVRVSQLTALWSRLEES
ncbi:MAG TPA: lipid II flippase MurJ [Terriglobia bacterium]|nr:lipid II flippase MurJ [Terriglobia bacterium]